MATCSYCRSTIFIGGVTTTHRRFCNTRCQQCFIEACSIEQTPATRFDDWESISLHARAGVFLHKKLSMLPEGIQWGKRHFDLDSITGIRWELTRITVNRVYRTTNCEVGVADRVGSSTIDIRNELTYWRVVNFLWCATAGRLMREACQALACGQTLTCGPIAIEDQGVTVKQVISLLGSTRSVHIPLRDLKIELRKGHYSLSSLADQQVLVFADFRQWNVHVLFHLLRLACHQPAGKISEAFSKQQAAMESMA